MENTPLVSIITPVYNAEDFIEKTIESVRNQTVSDFEFLLVDDDSTDKSTAVVRRICEETGDKRLKLIINDGEKCAAGARNKGLSESKGRFVTYIDADDLWEPDKLEKQLKFMADNDATFSFTSYEFCDADGESLGKTVHVPMTLNYKEALTRTTIFTSTVMFDTEKIAREELKMPIIKSEDTALWWRILRGGVVAYGLDEVLVKYRRVGVTLSSNKLNAIKRIWALYRVAEGFGVLKSFFLFISWAFRTFMRRGLK